MIATFDIRGIEVGGQGGNINVTCIFARGSEAKGCMVSVTYLANASESPVMKNADRRVVNGQLSQTASTVFTGLQNGTYMVIATDVEVDGSFDLGREAESQVVIIIDAQSSTSTPSSTLPSTSPTPSSELSCCMIVFLL